jgi:Ca2+-binding RTX toxin-like protein
VVLLASPSARAADMPRCNGVRATIVGTSGEDEIRATSGRDVVQALAGKDRVWGLGGDDLLCGGRGGDRLYGGPRDDKAIGGLGADRVRGGGGDDFVDVADSVGGNDFEPLDASGATSKHGTYGVRFIEGATIKIMAPGGAATAWFDPMSKVHVFDPPGGCS